MQWLPPTGAPNTMSILPTHPTDHRRWPHALLTALLAVLGEPRYWLIVAWVLTMISIPIIRWVVGDGVLHWGVIAGVLLQAGAVLAVVQGAWGTRETLRVAAIVIPLAWLVERIGSTTGFPFGSYYYTASLAPLLGGVPLIIPIAWLMMLPAAWAVGAAISGRSHGWRFVAISALAFTVWDLFLDPQMVGWGYSLAGSSRRHSSRSRSVPSSRRSPRCLLSTRSPGFSKASARPFSGTCWDLPWPVLWEWESLLYCPFAATLNRANAS
jgi:hypothetical protein